ncbi:hypothetical protein AVEN_234143-1, partial [Araneus ventricosus]
MDVNAENVGYRKLKFSKRTYSVCETPGSKLFRIPSNENVWCFTSTLRQKLIKFACPFTIGEDIQSTSSDTFPALSSAAFLCTSVEVCEAELLCSESIMNVEPSGSESIMDAEPSCSESFMFSPTSSHYTSSHLQ